MRNDFFLEYLKRSKTYKGVDFSDNTKFKDLHYYPYIGPKYENAPVKILVLGESLYTKKELYHEQETALISNGSFKQHFFSEDVLSNVLGHFLWCKWKFCFNSAVQRPLYSSGNDFSADYQKTACLINCSENNKNPHNNPHSNYIWDYLAFHEYFQRVAGFISEGDTNRHDKRYFNSDKNGFINEAQNALKNILDNLTPDIVIVWGQFLDYGLNQIELQYPQITFFRMCHPAKNKEKDVEGWKGKYPNTLKKWKKHFEQWTIKNGKTGLSLKNLFYEAFPTTTIETIHKNIKKQHRNTCGIHYGNTNNIFEIDLQKHGNKLYLELDIAKDDSSVLYIYTQDHSSYRASTIISLMKTMGTPLTNKDELELGENGHYIVKKYRQTTANTALICKEIAEYLTTIHNFKTKFLSKTYRNLNELKKEIDPFFAHGTSLNFYSSDIDKAKHTLNYMLHLSKIATMKKNTGIRESDQTSFTHINLHNDGTVTFDFNLKKDTAQNAVKIVTHQDYFDFKEDVLNSRIVGMTIKDFISHKTEKDGNQESFRLDVFTALEAITFLKALFDYRKIHYFPI